MTVLLTGGTGLIGAAVLRRLRREGRPVLALVRSDHAAETVRAAGATPLLGDLRDTETVMAAVAASDGVIHTASPGDHTSAVVDAAFTAAVLSVLRARAPYVHTGGAWVFGAGAALTEESPLRPPRITAWRLAVEQRIRASPARTTVVAAGIVYGPGGQGVPAMFRPGPEGVSRTVGDGAQRWTSVHAEDLAELYVLALDAADPDGYVIGASGDNPSVGAMAAAAAGGRPVVTETSGAARARLGRDLADALLMDQAADGGHARRRYGWRPQQPGVLIELSAPPAPAGCPRPRG